MPKKQRKTKKTSKRYELYDKTTRKNKFCPKCGPGIFLANHKERFVCGKCGYMEKAGVAPATETKEKPDAKKEAPKKEATPKADKPKEAPKEEKPEEKKE